MNLKETNGRWQMNEHQLRAAVGKLLDKTFAKDRWPDEGVSTINVDGTFVYVKPKTVNEGMIGRAGMKHRARAVCMYCNEDVPAGRLHQHQKGAACKEAKAAFEQGEVMREELRTEKSLGM